jgi:hypothetical protein
LHKDQHHALHPFHLDQWFCVWSNLAPSANMDVMLIFPFGSLRVPNPSNSIENAFQISNSRW